MMEKRKFVLGKEENIVGKGENAGYQHFLIFPQYFQKAPLSRSLKFGTVGYRVDFLPNNKISVRMKFKACADDKIECD